MNAEASMADTQPDAKIISKLCVYENQHEKCSLQGCSCRCHQTTQPDDLEAEVEGLLPCFTAHPMFPTDCGDPDKGGTHALGCPGFFRSHVLAALRKQRERIAELERGPITPEERDEHEARITDLERQLAEVREHMDKYHSDCWTAEQGRDLTAQLAEAKAMNEAKDRIINEARADYAEAKTERDKYHDALIARHGGEPVALLSELDEARERLAEAKAELERLK